MYNKILVQNESGDSATIHVTGSLAEVIHNKGMQVFEMTPVSVNPPQPALGAYSYRPVSRQEAVLHGVTPDYKDTIIDLVVDDGDLVITRKGAGTLRIDEEMAMHLTHILAEYVYSHQLPTVSPFPK